MMRRVLLLLALLVPAAAQAAPPPQTWMTVLLGGRKIGHLEVQRQWDGDRLVTTQTLRIELNRSGTSLPLEAMSRSVEDRDHRPLGFAARTHMSADDTVVDGRRGQADRFRVVTTVGGQSHAALLDWPGDAVLAEGQRQAIVAAGRRPGSRYTLREFDPASQQVITVQMEVLGEESVSLPGGVERLSHQRQTLALSHGSQAMDVWIDDQGIARKGLINLLGQPLEMLACDRACAMAPNQSVDMLRAATVRSPRLLPGPVRAMPLRFWIRVDGDSDQPFITTGEQLPTSVGSHEWVVDVGPAKTHRQAPPLPSDQAPNAWLQSDAPLIRELAARAVGDAGNDRERMNRLRAFVSDYITEHGLDVGYASALEVARTRQGDCTEFAVLLAAMARAQGIPARVVSGMAYADRYAGMERVFIPHEWVQAWVDGRWRSYDAALRRFDAAHLALFSGDGDPWHFAAATAMFGRVHIRQVESGSELMPFIAPAAPPAPVGGGGLPGG